MLTTWIGQRAKLAALLLFSFCLTNAIAAAPAHPHLYFTSADIAALRARTNQTFYMDQYERLRIQCQFVFGPDKTIPNSTRSANARAMVSHAVQLLLDPNGRAADPAVQSNVLFFSYFNTCLNWSKDSWSDFFGETPLDTSFFLIALCIGYDMHYDKFSSSQRADIVSKLATRADYITNNTGGFFDDPATLSGPTPWKYKSDFLKNKAMIAVGALGLIAYTLEGEVDETRRQKWLAKTDEMLNIWNANVARDGMSHEGYSYQEYMFKSLMPMLYARSRRTGVNQFTLLPNVKNYPLYSIYSWVPGGDRTFVQPMPFADCDTEPPAPISTHQALAAHMLKGDSGKLDQLLNWMQYKGPTTPANCSYYRTEGMQIIWADSSIAVKSPDEINLPRFHYFPDRGGFVWRSGWDNMATYFAMICGATIGHHQHPEMGNFVIHKGGSPFIAHHGYNKSRRTESANLMMVNGQGQYGDRYDDGNGNTEPEPPELWASITRVVADNDYFNVMTKLRPIYRDLGLSTYTREFMQASGVFFVYDKLRMATGSTGKFESILNAYSTVQPEYTTDAYNALDIDSNPSVNPWAGTGRTHTITPRTSGPFTGSMTVQDLSKSTWSPTVAQSIVNNKDNVNVRRGNRLVLTQTAASGDLLVGFYFPVSGRTVTAWPDSTVSNGFMIKSGSTVQALGAWSDSGSVNSSGLTMAGPMGGLDLVAKSFWGRELTSLKYNGRLYFSATKPVSVYCVLTGKTARARLQSDASATVSFYHPDRPTAVKLNGATLSQSSWNYSGGMLNVTLAAQSSQALIETVAPPKNTAEADWAIYE